MTERTPISLSTSRNSSLCPLDSWGQDQRNPVWSQVRKAKSRSSSVLLSTLPVSQDARSGPVWSWVTATEPLLPLLFSAQWEGTPRQDHQPTCLPGLSCVLMGEGQEHKSKSSHRVSESWMGRQEAPLVRTWHPGWSCSSGGPRWLQAGWAGPTRALRPAELPGV